MPRLAKVSVVELDGERVFLRFYEDASPNGRARYSVEVRFGPHDQVVFDGDDLAELEATAVACLPASWASRRMLTGGSGAR